MALSPDHPATQHADGTASKSMQGDSRGTNSHAKGLAIEVSDLTVAYHDRPVLWDVDVEVPSGVLMAVAGPNGAGKTTLFNAVTGTIPASSGSVIFHGLAEPVHIQGLKPDRITRLGIARTYQNIR